MSSRSHRVPALTVSTRLSILLKSAGRRFGLVAVDAYEDRSSPLEISNEATAEFRELRDAILEKRAQKWEPRP